MKKYLIGYNQKMPFENEKGKEIFLNEFVEIAVLNSPFEKEKTLNIFIERNKQTLKERNIKPKSLIIEEDNALNFNEMINAFKGDGLKC